VSGFSLFELGFGAAGDFDFSCSRPKAARRRDVSRFFRNRVLFAGFPLRELGFYRAAAFV
jgi:hypothetical protein